MRRETYLLKQVVWHNLGYLVIAVILCLVSQQQAVAQEMDLFERMTTKAKKMAAQAYQQPEIDMPKELAEMTYQQYRSIRFRPEASLWRGESQFEVQLFPPGFLYQEPVTIAIVDEPGSRPEAFDFTPSLFSFDNEAESLSKVKARHLGYAGFRVHYPLNSSDYKDEFLVFQGASYFRLVGAGHRYGLSARGLAVNTATLGAEEFPVFREFWLVKPGAEDRQLTIYALLDSPSISGAYRFEISPDQPTSMVVEARLFPRVEIHKLGIAPLTSMFFFAENKTHNPDDFRPEVHDSDGLLIQTRRPEWIWRPLTNPGQVQATSQVIPSPVGFGLVQRDRQFAHYEDNEARYEKRPSLWVEPLNDWGKGRIELVEIPSDMETNDNIVAYWVSATPVRAGTPVHVRYKLSCFDGLLPQQVLGHVAQTRIGWGAVPGMDTPPPRSTRQFIVDFTGVQLAQLPADQPLKADFSAANGVAKDLHVFKLDDGKTWRVAFKLEPDNLLPVDMRLMLKLYNQPLTEVWNYLWHPGKTPQQ